MGHLVQLGANKQRSSGQNAFTLEAMAEMEYVGTTEYQGYVVEFTLQDNADGSTAGVFRFPSRFAPVERWVKTDMHPKALERELALPQGVRFVFRVWVAENQQEASGRLARVEGRMVRESGDSLPTFDNGGLP